MNTPIRTGLLSFGVSGKYFHAPFLLSQPGFELVGAWERSKQQIAESYPGSRSYPTLESLLADPQIELVVVNTPNDTHYAYAQLALRAGKHVVVEKAFTTTTAEAEHLVALAGECQKSITVYHNRRWDSEFLTIQKLLQEDRLGPIVDATFRYDRYRPALSAKLHKETASPGSGLWKDLGPHLTDQALVLWGMPEAVQANIRITRPGSVVDDWFVVQLLYPNKTVTLMGSCLVREKQASFVLNGLKGSFLKHRADVQEAALMAGESPAAVNWGVEPATAQGWLHTQDGETVVQQNVVSEPGNYGRFYELLYKALKEGGPLPVSPRSAIQVMEVIDAAVKSNVEGCRIGVE